MLPLYMAEHKNVQLAEMNLKSKDYREEFCWEMAADTMCHLSPTQSKKITRDYMCQIAYNLKLLMLVQGKSLDFDVDIFTECIELLRYFDVSDLLTKP